MVRYHRGFFPLFVRQTNRMQKEQRRYLSLHEYQSMGLFDEYGVEHPKGFLCTDSTMASSIFKELGSKVFRLRHQFSLGFPIHYYVEVLAGGRGKGHWLQSSKKVTPQGGGIQVASSEKQAIELVEQMLGSVLVTSQTGVTGRPCSKVYMCELARLGKEFYFAILLDRKSRGPILVASSQGGMDIEKVAETNPSSIHTMAIEIKAGLSFEQVLEFGRRLNFSSEAHLKDFVKNALSLYSLFMAKDAILVEINPMAEVGSHQVFAIDAKINIDENASFRQPNLFSFRDFEQEDPREVLAAKSYLNYIGLDGSIGCLVNGAGLAMATMDIIKLEGGNPANFLDVGGSASVEQVTDAFKILVSDERVSSILVNIFGGIMRCDIIAHGIVNAASSLSIKVPLIVRLQGFFLPFLIHRHKCKPGEANYPRQRSKNIFRRRFNRGGQIKRGPCSSMLIELKLPNVHITLWMGCWEQVTKNNYNV